MNGRTTNANHRTGSPRSAESESIVDPVLMDLLLNARDPISVETLAVQLHTSPQQVAGQLYRLVQAGCEIQTHPQHGVKLVASGLGTWADYLAWSVGRHSGRMIDVYAQISSTQDAARRIVESCGPAADGSLVIADSQTAGRGRLGRRWFAPPGTAVTFSRVCLLPQSDLSIDRLTLATTTALTRTIEPHIRPTGVQIKWPNDLMINEHKVAGILVETFSTPAVPHRVAAVIGVGINVALDPESLPPSLKDTRSPVGSVWMFGPPVDRLKLLAQAIDHMDRTLAQCDPTPMLREWRRRCPLVSKRLRLSSAGHLVCGQVIDLDPRAGLIVRTDSGCVVHLPAATTTIL